VRLSEISVRDRECPLVVGYGGGVNSKGLLVGLYERGLRPDLISFADTGGEKPETYSDLDLTDAWLKSISWPAITRVKLVKALTPDKTLEEQCMRLETLPSRAFGHSQCALRWKIEPQDLLLRNHPVTKQWIGSGHKVIKVLGYDGGEERRADISDNALCIFWYPLLHNWNWSREDCVQAIKRHGLSVPVKSACFFCPSSKKSEIVQLSLRHPDLMRRALEMEAKAKASGKWAVAGLGRNFSWTEFMAAQDKESFPEAPVESCTICAEGEE
jgi:hypothetical protein